MSYKTTESVFVIREIATGKLVKFGSKCGWISSGAAKSAFCLHMRYSLGVGWEEAPGLFDRQDKFVIEEVA
jgi:hypothetical protein